MVSTFAGEMFPFKPAKTASKLQLKKSKSNVHATIVLSSGMISACSDTLKRASWGWHKFCQEHSYGIRKIKLQSIKPDVDALALIYQLIKEATNTSMLFRANGSEVVTNSSEHRYGLVQCTRDLNSSSCSFCLSQLMVEAQKFSQQKAGWHIFRPSCNIRHENYIFYQQNWGPDNASTPPMNQSDDEGSAEEFAYKVRATVVMLVLVAMTAPFLGFASYACFHKKRRLRGGETTDEIMLQKLEILKKHHTKEQGAMKDEYNSEVQNFSFKTIKVATNYFSEEATLGKGGFGLVFKGGDQTFLLEYIEFKLMIWRLH